MKKLEVSSPAAFTKLIGLPENSSMNKNILRSTFLTQLRSQFETTTEFHFYRIGNLKKKTHC